MLSATLQEKIQFQLPVGACDCHTHIFGPVEQYPYWTERTYTPDDSTIEQLRDLHLSLGIQRTVIVHPSPYGPDNRRSSDAIAKIGTNARGVAVIDETTITFPDLEKLHQIGFRGARLNLETAGVADPEFARNKLQMTAKLIQPFGWHIQIFSSLHMVTELAKDMMSCEVPVVLDHFARVPVLDGLEQPKVLQLLKMLKEGNVWMKLSAPQRVSDDPDSALVAQLARMLIEANTNRMVWGSDWPHSGAHYGKKRSKEEIEPFHLINDGHALNRLAHWAQTPQLIQKILTDNPASLYDFPSI
jgi:predicted TIM-barrel fold metal-dependent hydrolase